MIRITVETDPKTFQVSMSAVVNGEKVEVCDPLHKPNAEEIGKAITNFVEEIASVKWPVTAFRLQDRNSHAFVREVRDGLVIWTPDFDCAELFSSVKVAEELMQNDPNLKKITGLG